MDRWNVNAPIFDVPHDVGHNLPRSFVALAKIVEDGGPNDYLRSYYRHERFAGECKVEKIMGRVHLCTPRFENERDTDEKCEIEMKD